MRRYFPLKAGNSGMSLGGGGGQLEELSQQLQELESQKEQLDEQIEALTAEQAEIDEAIEALDVIESDGTVQVPLGGGAYVRATIGDVDEIVVDIGGGFAAEQDREGATETLENKKDLLDEDIEEVKSQIAELEAESDKLEEQAQQAQQQMIQQQMAQQQGQQDQE